VRVNVLLGPDIVISEAVDEATGGRRDSKVTAEPEATGWGVVIIGVETKAFFLPFNFESALVGE
jgi:hypothetical protein